MSLSETSKLTCLEGWRGSLIIRESGREPTKTKKNPAPSSKFFVQIAQISMCFWQHCPHYIALTLYRNRQSVLGVLCSERTGTVSDSEALIKEWCEGLLANFAFAAPQRTGLQTAEPTNLRKTLNGHARDSLFAEVSVHLCQCSKRSKKLTYIPLFIV